MKPNLNNYQEALDILQEECAEVIVEVSKCRRFGFTATHYKTGLTHTEMLENEIGDVLAMIDILREMGVVSSGAMEAAKQAKIEKLKLWSKIYEQN
jgi:NTP pyrophosphatase (non-canonical NTP hydrolase)